VIKTAHRIRLNLTPEQEAYFWRAAGTARYSFNWGLDHWNLFADYNRRVKQAGIGEIIPISGRRLKKLFNRVKPVWVNEVTSWAYQGAFDDLQAAVRNCRESGRGWPRFKSKRKTTPAFYLANSTLKVNGHFVRFDKGRVGWVNMAETLRFDGRLLGGRISYRQGHWWLSIQVEIAHETPAHEGGAVGVDLGIKLLAKTSDGQEFENPKALKAALAKLRRYQRKLDRQRRANNPDNYNENGTAKKGRRKWVTSNKMRRTEGKITKLAARVANLRNEASHRMTTEIVRNYAIIGIEDLNVSGMMKNRRLAQAVADAAFFEKRRQLTYKAERNGGVVVVIDRWFPSSKRCSQCGYVNAELKLSEREWTCPECGTSHHRDGNAAVNIRNEALKQLNNSPVLPGSDLKAPAETQPAGANVVGEPTP